MWPLLQVVRGAVTTSLSQAMHGVASGLSSGSHTAEVRTLSLTVTVTRTLTLTPTLTLTLTLSLTLTLT